MAPTDAEILKGGLTAFAQGDIPAVVAIFHEDIVWHVPGTNLVAGTYTGHQEVLGFLKKLRELTAGTIKVTPSEIFDNGSGTVLVFCKITGERGERSASFDAVQAWGFADGNVTSCEYFYNDQAAVDTFWS